VRQRAVQALGGAEQRLGGGVGAQLVQRDARVVEEQRLARLGLERVEGRGGDGGEALGDGLGGLAGRAG
jgi:hypothetical protein